MVVGGVIGGVAVFSMLSGFVIWRWMQHTRENSQDPKTSQAASTGQVDFEEFVVPQDNRIHEVDALRDLAELELRQIAELEMRQIAELEMRQVAELEHSTTPRMHQVI